MKKDPEIFVEHILECIKRIEEYTEGITKDVFFNSTQIQDAIIRRIEIIGEAVKNIPGDIKDKYPDIPWKQIAGMRDILIHEYFGIDIELTWEVAKEEIFELKKKILSVKEDLKEKR
ncbi:DUF86 domain-containing protein [bacterium]|nr:DUF86 domain-containing protein [bacterium]MCG2675879.1 DUF86 domain-containing protein [bacterium]